MLTIPLQAVPSQRVSVSLEGQACQIAVAQRFYGVYLDLDINNTRVLTGAKCVDKTRIVRDGYLGFSGDLLFYDTEGSDDPRYTEIGTRFVLLYLTPADVEAVI